MWLHFIYLFLSFVHFSLTHACFTTEKCLVFVVKNHLIYINTKIISNRQIILFYFIFIVVLNFKQEILDQTRKNYYKKFTYTLLYNKAHVFLVFISYFIFVDQKFFFFPSLFIIII